MLRPAVCALCAAFDYSTIQDDCGGSLGRQRLQASCVMLESLLTKITGTEDT